MALGQGSTGMRVGWTLNQLYEDGKLLRRWQVAQTAQLDKSNGKAGPKAVRLINIMCPLGKVFFKRIWETQDRQTYDFSYGYTKNRRREQAILVKHVVSWKLRKKFKEQGNRKCKDYNHTTTYRDVANAFPSPKHEKWMRWWTVSLLVDVLRF